MSENNEVNTGVETMKAEIKAEQERAKEFYGPVNYAFIQLDQPRGWKGFLAKGVVNGAITTGCVLTGLAIRDHYKARKQGKILTLNTAHPQAKKAQ